MSDFMSGVVATTFLVAGLYFRFFWLRTRDRLFFFFSLSCFILVIERVCLVTVSPQYEFAPLIYVIRLVAFVVLLLAIISKNLRSNTIIDER